MSVVDAVFGRAGVAPTGAPKKRSVLGTVVEDVDGMEVDDSSPDAVRMIDELEKQLADKEKWITEFRKNVTEQMTKDKQALRSKDDELRMCHEELRRLKAIMNRKTDLKPLWKMFRDAERKRGLDEKMLFTDAMGYELEQQMKAEEAARMAKEDAEAQEWMRNAQGLAPGAAAPAAAAGPSAPSSDASAYEALTTLANRAEALRMPLVQAQLFRQFVDIYNVLLVRAYEVLNNKLGVDGKMLFDFVARLEEAEKAMEEALKKAQRQESEDAVILNGTDDEDDDDAGVDADSASRPRPSTAPQRPVMGKAPATRPKTYQRRRPVTSEQNWNHVIRTLKARANEARRLAPKLKKAGLYDVFADLYTQHVPKVEEVLAKNQYYAYIITQYAIQDRLEEAKKALAARYQSGN